MSEHGKSVESLVQSYHSYFSVHYVSFPSQRMLLYSSTSHFPRNIPPHRSYHFTTSVIRHSDDVNSRSVISDKQVVTSWLLFTTLYTSLLSVINPESVCFSGNTHNELGLLFYMYTFLPKIHTTWYRTYIILKHCDFSRFNHGNVFLQICCDYRFCNFFIRI